MRAVVRGTLASPVKRGGGRKAKHRQSERVLVLGSGAAQDSASTLRVSHDKRRLLPWPHSSKPAKRSLSSFSSVPFGSVVVISRSAYATALPRQSIFESVCLALS